MLRLSINNTYNIINATLIFPIIHQTFIVIEINLKDQNFSNGHPTKTNRQ